MKKYIFIFLVLFSCKQRESNNMDIAFEKNGHFFIEATINDSIHGHFVFDTGASGLFLDSTFIQKHPSIKKLGLDTTEIRGAGSTEYKKALMIKNSIKVTFGGTSHWFKESPILRLTDINGEGIAGIIGNEFISNKILIINNELNKMRIDSIIDPNAYETEISFNYNDDRIYLPVDIQINANKSEKANLMLDLGCADAIILNTLYFNNLRKNNILSHPIINYTILFGGAVGGNSDGGEFRASSIAFGDVKLNEPIISFSKDTLGAFSKTNYDGLIGNDIFDRFNYAIDYSKRKIYLNKNNKIGTPFRTTKTGFYAQKINEIARVQSIYYESDAYKNGLRLGDTILSINNKLIKDLTEEEFYSELKEEGRKTHLIIHRKGMRKAISFTLKYLL